MIDPTIGLLALLQYAGDRDTAGEMEKTRLQQGLYNQAALDAAQKTLYTETGDEYPFKGPPVLTPETQELANLRRKTATGAEQTAGGAGDLARALQGKFRGLDEGQIRGEGIADVQESGVRATTGLQQQLNRLGQRDRQDPAFGTSNFGRFTGKYAPELIAANEQRFGGPAQYAEGQQRYDDAIKNSLNLTGPLAAQEAGRATAAFDFPQQQPAQSAQVMSQIRAPAATPSPIPRVAGTLAAGYNQGQNRAVVERFLGNQGATKIT
jgi:hypothetical protein